jgi:hypothetical protein
MELKDYQKKLLKEGNRYTFANIFIEKYLDKCGILVQIF